MDHMSLLDSSFFQLDQAETPLHVGSLMIFEGPAPTYDDFLAVYRARLHLVPRYRQKVRAIPLQLATPVWVDDPHFSLEYHIRHTALPRPGDDDQLRRLVARVMSVHLDFRRPPWEVWLVEGLPQGRWALINKVHHCMIDGMSGADITSLLLAREPDAPLPAAQPWEPEPEPGSLGLALDGAARAVAHPLQRAAHIVQLLRESPKAVGLTTAATAKGAWSVLGSVAPEPFGLNGPTGPNRRWTWVRGSLDDVKAVRRATGTTVNDVILAAITLGFRRWLLDRGHDVDGRALTSMVPVSTRPPGSGHQHDNQVTALFADLPVGLSDPLQVLSAVSGQMSQLKASGEAVSSSMVLEAADFIPTTLFALGARVAVRSPQRSVATVTTNVPGPPYPLYLLHSRMLEMFPFVPLGVQVRVTVGIFSYNGAITMGINGDYDAMPDLNALGEHIEKALAALVAAAPAEQNG